jgi:hypothetical protein
MSVLIPSLVLSLSAVLSFGESIDLGKVDQSKPPTREEIAPPSAGDGSATVGLHASVKAAVPKDEARHVYVLISPVSNSETRGRWWVQNQVARDKDAIECDCQFGEENNGKDEFFAIVVAVSDDSLEVGQILEKLPEKASYSKPRIVKRK